MNEHQTPTTNHPSALDGAFAETAFTPEDINRAITEEERLGVRDVPCDLVGGVAG